MSSLESTRAPLEFPKPPTTEKQASNCPETLEWLKTNVAAIYSAGREAPSQDSPPTLARSAYLAMYTTVHNFCADTRQTPKQPSKGPLSGEDLYRGLKAEIETHCSEVRTLMLTSRNSAEADDARRMINEYLAHWQTLTHMASLVTRLMQPLEKEWIARCISAKQKDIFPIKDLHNVVWKHEILEVGIDSEEATTGSQIESAMKTLQVHGDDGSAGDRELVETFVKSLESIGVGPGRER
jgi:hypothetical protein